MVKSDGGCAVLCGGTRPDILRPFRSTLATKLGKTDVDRKVLEQKVKEAIEGHNSQADKDERFDAELRSALLDALVTCETANASVQEPATSLLEMLNKAEPSSIHDEPEVERLLKSEVMNVSIQQMVQHSLAAHIVVCFAGR